MTDKYQKEFKVPKHFFVPLCAHDARVEQIIEIEDWGKTREDVLGSLCGGGPCYVYGILYFAKMLPDITRDDIYKRLEKCKAKRAKDNKPVFGWGGEKLGIYGQMVSRMEYGEVVLRSQEVIETLTEFVRSFYRIQLYCNSHKIYQLFKNTPVFPIILEALGIVAELDEVLDDMVRTRHYNYYYKGFKTKEEVFENFGESYEIEEHFQPDRKLTEDDYKIILEAFCGYLDYVQKSGIKKRLTELATQIRVFNQYFVRRVDSKEFDSIDAALNRLIKEAKNKQETPPPVNPIVKKPKEPTQEMRIAYQLTRVAAMTQEEAAEAMSKQFKKPIKQYSVSRWANDFAEYLKHNSLPVEEPGKKPGKMIVNTDILDIGERTDGRKPPQK